MGATVVFAPSVKEMYPTPDNRHFEFPPVSTVMEGAKRPGHFNGVCQVVSRLFYIVRPNRAYFGEKDWQQIAVIKQLVRHLNLNIKIVECAIIREYFSIVDGNTLQDVSTWEDSNYIVGCITVYCGKTPIRLIDHIKYKED